MSSTIIKLKINMVTRLSFIDANSLMYKIRTEDVSEDFSKCIKSELKMSLKILVRMKKYLILVIIQISQNIMMIQTN